MKKRACYWVWRLLSSVLVSSVLVGCAAAPSAVVGEHRGCEERSAAFEEVCQQPDTLLALCDAAGCAAYRCWDLTEALEAGQVVRTQALARPPLARSPLPRPPSGARTRAEVGSAWNGPWGVPQQVTPVLVIPWRASARALPPPERAPLPEGLELLRSRPYEKHHIYPQEERLKGWFESKGINIHEWTLALEVEDHRRIHRGAKGGPWNEAWRRFQTTHPNATKLEIELHAGKLIYEFNLYGVVVPYGQQLLRLPSNLLEPD